MPVTSDQPHVFTANVSGCNPGEPREVRWYVNGTLTEVDAAPGPYDFLADPAALGIGTHTIRADVIGDGNDACTAGSVVTSSSDTFTVPPAAEEVTVEKTAIEASPLLHDNFDSNPVMGIGDQIDANPYGSVEACPGQPLGQSVRISYPQGSVGGGGGGIGGMDFPFQDGVGVEEAYLRYRFKFDPGFQFARSGKLPGLAGGAQPGGGGAPGGCVGWSARMTWDTDLLSPFQAGGVGMSSYLYYHAQPAFWGERNNFGYNGNENLLQAGVWHCVEQYVKMNTPGVADGFHIVRLDGLGVHQRTNVNWRDCAALKIDGVMFSSFFGGNAAEDSSPQNQFACFDDFHVSTKRIGGC